MVSRCVMTSKRADAHGRLPVGHTHSRVSDLECCRSSRKYLRLDCTSSSCSHTIDCTFSHVHSLQTRRGTVCKRQSRSRNYNSRSDSDFHGVAASTSLLLIGSHLVLDGLKARLHIKLTPQILPDAPVPAGKLLCI